MTIAIKYAGAFVEDGHVGGHEAGATLVRRLMRVFPGAKLVGGQARHAEGFDVVPLEFLDPTETVVINMDVVDSGSVWRALAGAGVEPKVMNFVWWNTSQFTHPVQRASLALSCAMFPTFANSERTATEIREIVRALTVPQLAEKARIAWVNLGIRLDHVQPREEPTVPIVLYPAIYLSDRKNPQLFLDVVEGVHKRTPINVEARLHESHLISEKALRLSRKDWAWVGPLTATREDYYHHLARTTAFLATAVDESYGLEYVEAMVAGAVGVFPDRPWARALLPEGYPFFYTNQPQAEDMLYRVVTDTAACRVEIDRVAGGDFVSWLRKRHDDSQFEKAFADQVKEWFGSL